MKTQEEMIRDLWQVQKAQEEMIRDLWRVHTFPNRHKLDIKKFVADEFRKNADYSWKAWKRPLIVFAVWMLGLLVMVLVN